MIAVGLGAAVALLLLVAAFPGAATSPSPDPSDATAPAAVESVGAARVVASSACTTPGARDTIEVVDPRGAFTMPLDACGSSVGSHVTVRMALVDGRPGGVPARLLGTGSDAALTDTATGAPGESPLTGRLGILLTAVAGLGTAGLLVAVARDRRRRAATGSARSARSAPVRTRTPVPARPTVSTSSSGSARRRSAGDCRRVPRGSDRAAAGRTRARTTRPTRSGARPPASGRRRQ